MNNCYIFARPIVCIVSILLSQIIDLHAEDKKDLLTHSLKDRYGINTALISPIISSIVRNLPTNEFTNSSFITFSVIMDAEVSNVDETDFSLTVTGISGAIITNVSGSGTNYLVTVNTGTGNGSIRLDVNSATDISPSLNNVPFTGGEIYTIDKTAELPVFLGINTDTGLRSDDAITKDPTINFFGTAEAYSTITLTSAIWGVIGTSTANNIGNWIFDFTTGLPHGNHTFTATSTDIAGNVSDPTPNFVVTIDAIAPPIPTIISISNDLGLSTTDHITKDQTLLISGTAEANSTIIISRTGLGAVGTTQTSETGNWNFDYSNIVLPNGTYTFNATTFDVAGNVSGQSTSFIIVIDTTAPSVPSFTSITNDEGISSSDLVTNDQTIGIYGIAEAQSRITLIETSLGEVGTIQADANGIWFFDYSHITLPSGIYTFSITAMDVAGNTTPGVTTLTLTIDAILPNLVISTTETNPAENTPATIQIEFCSNVSDFSMDDIIVYDGIASNFSGSGSIYTLDITPTGALPFTIDVVSNAATDVAGNWNTGTTSFQIIFGPCTSPTIDASPTSQLVCENSSVTFSVEASGSNLAYQWNVDEGFGFVSIHNGSIYTGTDTRNLTILSAAPTMNNYKYKCIVTGTCAPAANSNNAILTVHPLPVVTFSFNGNNTLCNNSSEITLPAGNPAGGIYLGNGISGQIFDPSQTGNGDYTISYTYEDNNGCSNSDSAIISVNTCTGISPMNSANISISIYPNPTYDLLTIISEEDNLKVSVHNSVGKILLNTELSSNNTNFSLKELPSGIYLIGIWKNSELIKEEKIVKY